MALLPIHIPVRLRCSTFTFTRSEPTLLPTLSCLGSFRRGLSLVYPGHGKTFGNCKTFHVSLILPVVPTDLPFIKLLSSLNLIPSSPYPAPTLSPEKTELQTNTLGDRWLDVWVQRHVSDWVLSRCHTNSLAKR